MHPKWPELSLTKLDALDSYPDSPYLAMNCLGTFVFASISRKQQAFHKRCNVPSCAHTHHKCSSIRTAYVGGMNTTLNSTRSTSARQPVLVYPRIRTMLGMCCVCLSLFAKWRICRMKGECRDWQRKCFFLVLLLGVCLGFYQESHRLSPIIILLCNC